MSSDVKEPRAERDARGLCYRPGRTGRSIHRKGPGSMSNNTSSKRSREPSFRGRPVPDDERDHALGFHWGTDIAAFGGLGLPAAGVAPRGQDAGRDPHRGRARRARRPGNDDILQPDQSVLQADTLPADELRLQDRCRERRSSDRYQIIEHDRAWPGRFGWQSKSGQRPK